MTRPLKPMLALSVGFLVPALFALVLYASVPMLKAGKGLLLLSGWDEAAVIPMASNTGGSSTAPETTPEPVKTPALTSPASTTQYANLLPWAFRITSQFGQYPNGGAHYGLDLDVTYGVIQTAPVGGVVEEVLRGCTEGDPTCGKGWGNHVWWQSDVTGHHILLAHFAKIEDWVQVGARFEAGKFIGVTGSTGYSSGPHVHVQVNPDRCCENAGSTNPAWEFPNLRCGEPVLGSRFGAACDQ